MSQTIAFRRIGRTPLEVSEVGLGAAPLGNLFAAITDEAAHATVQAAMRLGITYIDTAPYYGFGLSEQRVGAGLAGPRRVVVSTKVGRILKSAPEIHDDAERHGFRSPMPFSPQFDYTFDGVMRSWQASLGRLKVERVDILYIHDAGEATHGAGHGDVMRQLRGGGLRALEQLRSSGAVAAVGLGVNEIDVCLELLQECDLDVILLAGRYTLLEQGALDKLLPECARRGTSIVVGGPYNSGILATGTRSSRPLHFNYGSAPERVILQVRLLEEFCERFDVPLAAAALQFPLAHPQVVSVIPGLDSEQRVIRTLELYRHFIPNEFWSELKRQRLLRPEAPTPAGISQSCSV